MSIPSSGLFFRTYGATHTGLSRARNEDAWLIDDQLGLYVVADGVGGLAHGDQASQYAVDCLHKLIACRKDDDQIDWQAIFNEVNRQVYQKGLQLGSAMGIGTTLTCLFLKDHQAEFAHVGDTMLYLFREGDEQAYKLTVDHTVGQEFISRAAPGEPIDIPEIYMHSLTRCIGQPDPIMVDTGSFELAAGERLLLCTDGICIGWEHEQLAQQTLQAQTPQLLVSQLINRCNQVGGYDNITAITIFVEKKSIEDQPVSRPSP